MVPFYAEELLVALVTGVLSVLPTLGFGVAAYVFTAVAIYTISRRRGLKKPWLAWIPVVNVWLLGSISDQYQYVVKGKNKSKRKVLLVLKMLLTALTVVLLVMLCMAVWMLQDPHAKVIGVALGMVGLLLPIAGLAIATAVIRYMALYDVFRSLDPDNGVLFLVLSILFHVTEPFFLFFSRNKDGGMPPRRCAAEETTRQKEWESPETV